MLKIYLTRHGQDRDNLNGLLNGQRDEPLTDLGIFQAKDLAQKILQIGLRFDKIYSSPLQRAFKTGKIIAESQGIAKPEVIKNLIERNFGEMTGEPISSIEEKCSPNIIKAEVVVYFLKVKGAETFPKLLRRAKRVLGEVKKRHKDGNILLVTHGDFGKMIFAAYYKIKWEKALRMFHFGNGELIELSKGLKVKDAHMLAVKQYNR